MPETASREHFEQTVLPHLDAAYSLARWLTRNDQDAQDVTQEACLRAFRFFDGYQGGNMRAWLLTIVRNTCYTWLHQNRVANSAEVFDEEIHSEESSPAGADPEMQVPWPARTRTHCAARSKNCRTYSVKRWCCANWKDCLTGRSPT